ncbi:MAG: DUF6069 family protein [Candidatus Methylacidiphilales bacterium]
MNKVNFKQSIKAGATAAVVASAINAVLFFVFQASGILVDSVFVQPNQPLTIVPVIISSVLPTLIASMVFFLIEKYTDAGFKIFTIIAIVLGLFSLSSPFMAIANVPTDYAIVLDVMHVTVVVALLFFINKEVNSKK